jgi:hypothetical protein
MKDLWGDFDLLIGAYKNNLKITEVPVHIMKEKQNETKMTSVNFKCIKNVIYSIILL